MRSHRSMTWAAFLTVAALLTFAPGAVRAQDVIKIRGLDAALRPGRSWGIPHKNATELIFDEINSQGGLDVGGKKYKLEVVAYDHKYVIAEGVATVNRLIAKDGVKYISVLGGSVVKAIEEPVNEGRVLNLPLAYADGLVSPKNPLTFHAFPSPPGDHRILELDQGEAPADQARGHALAQRRYRLVVDQGRDRVTSRSSGTRWCRRSSSSAR